MIRPTPAQWDRAEAAAQKAAIRFAPIYEVLDWTWTAGAVNHSINAVPDARSILATLTSLLRSLRTDIDALTKRPVGGVMFHGTGGLTVEAQWGVDSVDIVIAFTDSVEVYGSVTEAIESEGDA